MSAESTITKLGYVLPPPAKPVASYIPARRVGNLLVIAGQVPWKDGRLLATGRVPAEVSPDVAQECARQCALNGLAAARAALGTLDAIAGVIRVGCFVACDAAFTLHPKIADGASDLLQAVFGESGRHARVTVGCPSLPLGAPVEVEMLLEVR